MILIGSEFFTTDGEQVVDVEEVRAASLKVNGPLQPDYWLPSGTVASVRGKRITLAFARDRLEHYRSSLPLVA